LKKLTYGLELPVPRSINLPLNKKFLERTKIPAVSLLVGEILPILAMQIKR